MNIIIIGAGNVGTNLAEILVREGHHITMIDILPRRLMEINEMFDMSVFAGSGSSYDTLLQAGVRDADVVLAMTNNDEINLLATYIAKHLGARKTVARVRKREYLDTLELNIRALMGIDLIVSPEFLVAAETVQFLANPDSMAMAHFAKQKIQLRQLVLAEDSTLAGKLVRNTNLPRGLLIAVISREDEIIIPRGDTILKPGDKVSFIGQPRNFQEAHSLFDVQEVGIKKVCIAGGGETGLYLAETLENQNYTLTMIDSNPERCAFLSDVLSRTQVIAGDVTNRYFLEEERINTTDVFIAVTGDDETNIMSSLLAKELGVKQCITKVDRPDYAEVIERVGIDLALSPRLLTSERILALLKHGRIKAISLIEEGRVEVIEYEIPANSSIAFKKLKEITLPRDSLVGMIMHKGAVRVPRGEDQLIPGDTVIIITKPEVVDKIEQFFVPRTASS